MGATVSNADLHYDHVSQSAPSGLGSLTQETQMLTRTQSQGSFQRLAGDFEERLLQNSLAVWVVFPAIATLQLVLPFLEPSCQDGFNNYALALAIVIIMHYLCVEQSAWQLAKSFISEKELLVLRTIGALRKRRRRFLLGILEMLSFFVDLTLPIIAWHCDSSLTEKWIAAWKEVPAVGPVAVLLVRALRFWGIALLFACLRVVLTGWLGIVGMWKKVHLSKEEESRISGSTFFGWAQYADMALMPSISLICQEMALERKWKYDEKKSSNEAMEGRAKAVMGKISDRTAWELEIRDHEEEERVEAAGKCHYLFLLLVKVFIGNIVTLWLLGSFLMISFHQTSLQGRAKIMAGMALSVVSSAWRCLIVTEELGLLGCILSLIMLLFIAWSSMKVYFAYQCQSHIWNLSTGCVTL